MAEKRYINIDFPFSDSPKGYYFKLNDNDRDAIKSDLLHLLLTNKGERLYMPDFGSDLRKYIFEPNDSITQDLKFVKSSTDGYENLIRRICIVIREYLKK